MRRGRGMARAVVSGRQDRIGALPDELLQYLMSFLLSRDAVRTCVLARRWRTLWKSLPALRISDPDSYDGATGHSTFVDDLLRLRDPAAPLQICDISSDCQEDANLDLEWADEAFDRIQPWLQYAVSCKVEILRVSFPSCATNMALISSHLKRLELTHMRFDGSSLHLSTCQVLEVLDLGEGCYIFGDISSQSLRHLNIDNAMFDPFTRLHISAPNLIGLQLIVPGGLTPTLDSMPSLATAYISVGEGWTDSCVCGHDPSCDICSGQVGESNYSHLLQALSSATHLNLRTLHPSVVIFRRDLKRRPVFSNLKTLWLDEWCVCDDFTGLVYFLQHSPALETLTIEVYVDCLIKEIVMETDASYEASEVTLQPKHLKAVRVICSTKEDVIIDSILKILCAHGVPSDRIDIEIDIEHFYCSYQRTDGGMG